jgi:hypothetical protein
MDALDPRGSEASAEATREAVAGALGPRAASEPESPHAATEPPKNRGIDGKRLARASAPIVALLLLSLVEFPICPTRLGLGVPCPGCGLTRATLAGFRLDWTGVLHFHPLAPLLTPLVAWSFAKPVLLELGLLKQAWVDRLPSGPKALWLALGVAMAALWIGRLLGYFGGHPDPVDLHEGLFYRAGAAIAGLFG